MNGLRVSAPSIAVALVIAAATYWAALCLVHTHVTSLSNLEVAVADGAIVLAALAMALRGGSRWLWILLVALAANVLLLTLLTGSFDAKAIRDPLVLIAFAGLGWRYGAQADVTRVVLTVGALVTGFALLEFIAPALFTNIFNIISFYAARGAVDLQALENANSDFFVSGARFDERVLLPFLGTHRVSSIFLEPVSMGNFGALAVAFALSLNRQRWRAAVAAGGIGILAILLADARFGSVAVGLFLLARALPSGWTRLALPMLPLVAIALLVGFALSDLGRGDDLPTRLAASGRVLLDMSPAALFGLSSYDFVTFDAGYAYAFSSLGLPMCVTLWAAFVLMPTPSPEALRYKLMIGTYICALLCISGTSLFALKTAGLAFFVLGALSRPAAQPAFSARWATLLQRPAPAA